MVALGICSGDPVRWSNAAFPWHPVPSLWEQLLAQAEILEQEYRGTSTVIEGLIVWLDGGAKSLSENLKTRPR